MGWGSETTVEQLELSLSQLERALQELQKLVGKLPKSGTLPAVYPEQQDIAREFVKRAQNAEKNCKKLFRL